MALRYNEKNIGEFKNECDVWFTYRNTSDEWAISHGLSHEFDTLDGVRFCTVKKTIVWVAIDEAEGRPVMEKWKLKKHLNWENRSE